MTTFLSRHVQLVGCDISVQIVVFGFCVRFLREVGTCADSWLVNIFVWFMTAVRQLLVDH